MALYFTMGVDCGVDRRLADRFVEHFDGFEVRVDDLNPVTCKSHHEQHRNIWFVCVYPCGMGYATLPESERRCDMVSDEAIEEVQKQLYAELPPLSGFRRAMFGGECFDRMTFATLEEDSDIDYPGMVFSKMHFPSPTDDFIVEPFTEGYLIVTGIVS